MSGRSKSPDAASPVGPGRRFRLRPRVWAGLLFVLGLGYGAHYAWQRSGPLVAQHPQYQLTAESIHITPPPPWIRSDVKAQVLRDARLVGTVSVLDDWDTLSQRIKDAFEFHPWVASVERITKRVPAALEIELRYRKPVAAVESGESGGVTFLPIDEHAVRLPEADLTQTERRYLPRITGVTGRPVVGEVWSDPRVIGGARLAASLADVWQQLRLVEIMAALNSSPYDETQVCNFEIITTGGTRIVWGAAPGQEVSAGEAAFDLKRKRLLDYTAQHGQLESIDGPAAIDVRGDLVITPRTARRKPAAKAK
jgi:hypothetical protein